MNRVAMPDRDTRRISLGRLGERLALQRLEADGYQILQRNYRCTEGEIDLVARHGDGLAFVEVRTRRGQNAGSPEESVTPAKQRKLVQVAQRYLQEHPDSPAQWRIDVVAVEFDSGGVLRRVTVHQNAVSGE